MVPHPPRRRPRLPSDPQLRAALSKLLVLSARPWSFREMQMLLGPSLAEQAETAFTAAGLITLVDGCSYVMSLELREELLLAGINAGRLEWAASILQHWRRDSARRGDLQGMAHAHEQMANLHCLSGDRDSAVADLQCALALRRLAGDLANVASLSWSLAGLASQRGDDSTAVEFLEQAATLASVLGLPQARRYQERLAALR